MGHRILQRQHPSSSYGADRGGPSKSQPGSLTSAQGEVGSHCLQELQLSPLASARNACLFLSTSSTTSPTAKLPPAKSKELLHLTVVGHLLYQKKKEKEKTILFVTALFSYFVSQGLRDIQVPWHRCGGQRTTYGNQLSPAPWAPGLKCNLQGLVASAFPFTGQVTLGLHV